MRDTGDSLCRQNSLVAFLRVELFFALREATTLNKSALRKLFYAGAGGDSAYKRGRDARRLA